MCSLLFYNQVFSKEVLQALSWTLVHSVWQGMLLALVSATIVFFTKHARPVLRYNLLTGSLLIFIIVVGLTFIAQVSRPAGIVVEPVTSTPSMADAVVTSSVGAGATNFITIKAIDFFNVNASWVVLTWLLIMALRCTQLTLALYGVYQLQRKQVFFPGEYWANRVAVLCRQLKISRHVQLLQSGIVKMPSVIGYLKPVILFPAGMLASLPVNEVEAILVHELAHIQRKDFLVNLLQNIIEIFFFFNLPVLWVSSLVKRERENCCDDIAVRHTDSRKNYINALMSFQEFNTIGPMVNAFAGEKNHLRDRVKRIIYNSNKTLNNMEKKFLAAGILFTAVFIFAFSPGNTLQTEVENATRASSPSATRIAPVSLPVNTDTVPVPKKSKANVKDWKISSSLDGVKYSIVSENDKVKELHVNGKKIPAEKMGEYSDITNKLLLQSKLDFEHSKITWNNL